MPITEDDLDYRLSGGVANILVAASLGGVLSAAIGGTGVGGNITTNVDNNDMADITSTQAADGVIIYRGFYYQNTHLILTWTNPVFWVESQTSSGGTVIDIGVAVQAVSVTMATIVDENTAPAGVTFSAPINKAGGIAITSLAPAAFRGTWLRYTVTGGVASAADQYTIKAEGDTLP